MDMWDKMQQRQCLKRWWLKIFQNGLKTDQEFPQIQTIQTKRIPLLDTSQWILGHQRWWEDLKSTQRKGVISRKRQLKWQLNSQKDCIYNKILIPYYRRLCMICGALFFSLSLCCSLLLSLALIHRSSLISMITFSPNFAHSSPSAWIVQPSLPTWLSLFHLSDLDLNVISSIESSPNNQSTVILINSLI